MEGYIKIYRSFIDWEWYGNANATRLFLHILLTVNYKDTLVGDLMVERGQGLYTIKGLAEELGMSEKMVRTSLDHLKRAENLAITRRSKNSLITVINYEWYQGERAIKRAIKGQSPQEKEKDEERKKEKKQKKIKKEEEREIRSLEEGEETRTRVGAEDKVKTLFNSACSPLPRLLFMTKARRAKVGELLETYSMEDVKQGFDKAAKSSFLTGVNESKWKATFDWLINVDNFAKVLEGNYDDDQSSSFANDEFFEAALRRAYGG